MMAAVLAMIAFGQDVPPQASAEAMWEQVERADGSDDLGYVDDPAGTIPHPAQPPVQATSPSFSKHEAKVLRREIERAGETYEKLGRCAGSMTPGEVASILGRARSGPAAEYLFGRYERGFRSPKSDAWCAKNLSR